MIFTDRNENKHFVKERTQSQIHKCLRSYISDDEIANYKYIPGSQFISKMNGNVYALFIDNEGFSHTFYVADYKDYIKEIQL